MTEEQVVIFFSLVITVRIQNNNNSKNQISSGNYSWRTVFIILSPYSPYMRIIYQCSTCRKVGWAADIAFISGRITIV